MVDATILLATSPLHRDHQTKEKGVMSSNLSHPKFLITERSSNFLLRPVRARRDKYPFSYIVENLGQKVTVTVDKPWTELNHLILDLIGHELYELVYKKIVENKKSWKNNYSQSFLYTVDDLLQLRSADITPDLEEYTDWFSNYFQLRMREKQLMEEGGYSELRTEVEIELDKLRQKINETTLSELERIYELRKDRRPTFQIKIVLRNFLKKYRTFFGLNRRNEYLLKLIKQTSDVRFTLDYPLQKPIIESYQYKGEARTKIRKTYIETVRVENSNFFYYSLDDDCITVYFRNFLGKLYIHNLLTLNTDWLPEKFLELSGYASAIYRRFFSNSKRVEQLELVQIVEFFGLMKNSNYPKVIKKAFEDLKAVGLINDFKFCNIGGKFSKGHVEIVPSSN